ncbi:MAG: hypothetical protein KDB05_19295 [Planctomycetales bacterium]|nr:hypothetical protein [Planctomycetales bacterium]
MRDFTVWLLATLGCESNCESGLVRVESVPESLRDKLGCEATLRLDLSGANAADSDFAVTPDSQFFRSLIKELVTRFGVARAVPASQPESVREVSQRLFNAYTVEGGSVHLGGCTLEDRAILRVTYLEKCDTADDTGRLSHHFIDLTGESISAELVNRLGLTELVPPTRSIRVTDDQSNRWQSVGEAALDRLHPDSNVESLLTTVVWCKYTEGKLSFVIGDATASIAFSGWAQLFVDGTEKPPALTCPSHLQGSHHLAATDDGQIVPVEAIAICSESGKRVLTRELESCHVTMTKALPEFFATCPASGDRVLRRTLVACATCQQLVSPTSCESLRCRGCRSLAKVSKDDPRMARLLGEYPKLDNWPRWKLAETTAAYVVVASSLTKRLLIVVDKHDLGVLRLAKGSQFTNKWTEASEVDRTAYLQ